MMKELSQQEIIQVSGGGLSANEAGGLILALGAIGGVATFAFAFPIAGALYFLSGSRGGRRRSRSRFMGH